MSTAIIFTRLTFTGLHHWPDAVFPDAHLASPHEHLFGVEVALPVGHDDREVTFEQLERDALACLPVTRDEHGRYDLGPWSCEHLARHIAACLSEQHQREVTCTVDEDDRRGASVTIEPEPPATSVTVHLDGEEIARAAERRP